jgi:YidC/Oxa1 family membrane protein insertase
MFEFIINFFNTFLYIPLFNALIFLYNTIPGHDFGIAIIALTLIIKIILTPLLVGSVKSQRVLQRVQPKIQQIQKDYKDDKDKQTKEILELYKNEKINPFSGLVLALIQLPVLIALYWVFRQATQASQLHFLYPFIATPSHVNFISLGFLNITKANIVMAAIAAVAQFFQTKMLSPQKIKTQSKEKDFADTLQTQMLFVSPLVTLVVLWNLPSALSLYWITSGLFSIVQQYFVLKKIP